MSIRSKCSAWLQFDDVLEKLHGFRELLPLVHDHCGVCFRMRLCKKEVS
jgi:hypothetical protein